MPNQAASGFFHHRNPLSSFPNCTPPFNSNSPPLSGTTAGSSVIFIFILLFHFFLRTLVIKYQLAVYKNQ